MKDKKYILRKIIVFSIFILGVLILLYPFACKLLSAKNQTVAIYRYDEKINNMENNKKENLAEELKTYNESLYNSKFDDTNRTNIANFYPKGEILSYIIIPKIHVNIPIYEGTSNSILEKGIGHLENTSFPTGGINTHSVLVGHSGLVRATLFNSLEELSIDDVFFIKNFESFLKYKICDINVVNPDEVEKLAIKENEDLVTLVTCTPKYINTHRLLVTGSREEIAQEDTVKIENEINEIKSKNNMTKQISLKKVIIFVAFIVIIILIFIFIFICICSA